MADYSTLLPNIDIRYDEPMSRHTSFKIGGPVQAMAFPKNENELAFTVGELRNSNIPSLIVGNGTNLLVAERPLEITAVKTPPGINGIRQLSDTIIEAYSGVSFSKLSLFACDLALTGLEFAHGIPGSVGGAVFMNAGAYGGETGALIDSVLALMPDGEIRILSNCECGFSYRHSSFCDNGATILSAAFNLKHGDKSDIQSKMHYYSEQRREKQPLDLPSAGSTFKRPPGYYAASMIDEAGLRGFSIGGAMVSEKHAGFIVNRGDATFNDVIGVIEHVKNTIFNRTGILLTPEIKIIGGV